MDGYITRDELIERVGITRMTLHRWEARGLLPKPETRRLPGSRRSAAVWPDWVIRRCERIKESQRTTRSLDAAVAMVEREVLTDSVYRDVFGLEPDVEFEAMRERNSARRASVAHPALELGENAERDALLESLLQTAIRVSLTETLGRDAIPARFETALAKVRIAERAEHIVRVGANPVLVWSQIGLEVLPDFRVADRLAGSDYPRPLGLIVPLGTLYQRARRLAGLEAFPDPVVHPARRVRITNGNDEIEVPYEASAPFGWEYLPQDRERIRTLFASPAAPEAK